MSKTSIRGKYNSSITRVRPVFKKLIEQNSTGGSWLPKLLRMATCNRSLAEELANNTGQLCPKIIQKRSYKDRILKHYYIPEINLEACFEKRIPPPERFLRWMIENPIQLAWLKHSKRKAPIGSDTRIWREKLFGVHGPGEITAAKVEALKKLECHGAKGSRCRWWAFEGFTEVDCYLETDKIILFVEGKRIESLASSISWFPTRNQLIRNLEVVQETAAGKDFAAFVIAEQDIDPVTPEIFVQSLPHFSPEEREELYRHYLGCILWKDVCETMGIDYKRLPDTTEDAVRFLR